MSGFLASIKKRTLWTGLAGLLLVGLAGWQLVGRGGQASPPASPAVPEEAAEASLEAVKDFCSKCHAYPPPDCFPRSEWRRELRQAYDFVRNSPLPGGYPSLESVTRFYEARAPQAFSIPSPARPAGPPPVTFTP